MNRRFLRTKMLEVKALAIPITVFWGVLFLLIANTLVTHGQFSNVPVTGFNADIVADGTAGSTPAASSTAAVDGVSAGYVFVSTTFGFSGTVCSGYTAANALPANNQITSTNTTTNTGITYTLQGYGNGAVTNNNALRITGGSTGTLTLVTPTNAAKLYLVSLGGGGAVTFNVTINYADGSSETVTNPSGGTPDWCGGAATYKLTTQEYFRINRTLTSCSGDAGLCQYLYEVPIPVSGANFQKNILSLTFNNTAGTNLLNILALGMQAPCAAPPAPTALSLNASTISTISGSFTASTATGYLVVRYPTGSTPLAPVAGTTYVAGTALGAGTVVSMGTTTSLSASGLSASSSYDIYVYGYNSGTTCGGPVFSTTALTGTQSTAACGAPTLGTVTAGVRTITVGPGANAATITAALADINTNGMNTPTILELQSNYTSTGETFPITFPVSPCTGSVNTLTLRPAVGANGLVIAGTNAGPTIDLNGATYVTIDGRPGGVGSSIAVTANGSLNATNLNIVNASATGAAIKLDNSAGNNTIEYCDLQGQNTNATNPPTSIAGVVYIENTGANGNDNNTITYCNIHSDSSTVFPTIGIYSLGTNVTSGYAITSNDNNVVTYNNIYDYFSASSGANSIGIELNYGNNGWNISNNSFFQTASRALNGTFNRAVWVIPYRSSGNVGNGFNISGNYIGGSSPQCGGTAYTLTGSGFFDGIRLEPADAATPVASNIQNNTIQNISITSSSSSDLLHGVAIAGSVARINILGNTIGSTTTNGSITLSSSASTPVAGHCIFLTGAGGSDSVQNNTVAGITISGSGNIFTGLYNTTAGIVYINNNTFGSLTNPQSIYLSNTATSTSTSRYVNGMRIIPSSAATCTITNNTIAGIYSSQVYTGSSSQVVGLYISTSSTNISGGVTGNVIRNIYTAAASTGSTTSSALIGIVANASNASISNVSGNIIDSLVCGAASGNVNVMGLYASGSTSVANTFTNNFIHSIIAPSDASATINGIYIAGGTSTFANNMIRLGINPDGTNYTTTATIYGINANTTSATNIYYNSIYIGGVGLGTTATNTFAFKRTGTSGTYSILDNIFVNNRSNATTGGTHYAISFATAMTGVTMNNNLYYANGTGGKFANNGTADVAAYGSGWINSDFYSVTGDPQFVNATGSVSAVDLHINTAVPTLEESHAVAIAGITTDYFGNSRSGYSGSASGSAPDIGANEYTGIFTPQTVCVYPVNFVASNVAKSTATVGFNTPLGQAPINYMYELRTSGAAGSGATGLYQSNYSLPTIDTVLNLTGLWQGTSYTLYARTYCGSGDTSLWTSVAFTTASDTLTPVALSGFNYDVIANGIGAATTSSNINVDGGSPGYVFASADFYAAAGNAALTYGLPVNGIIQNGIRKYQLNSYSANNSLRMLYTTGNVGTVHFLTPKQANKVYVMGVGVVNTGSAGAWTTTVYFNDGTTQTESQGWPNWFTSSNGAGEPNAVNTFSIGRVIYNSTTAYANSSSGGPYLLDSGIVILPVNRTKEIDSISFTVSGTAVPTNIMHVLAVSIIPNNLQTCAVPASVAAATTITPNGATISWTGNGSNTNYDISYGVPGMYADSGTIIANVGGSTGANTYALTGLGASSSYLVFVRSNCGSGSKSDWIGPVSFNTLSDSCTGVPATDSVAASATTVCTNTPYTINAYNVPVSAGISLKWESSPSGQNTWTTLSSVIPAVGTTTYGYSVATQSAATDYRTVITCAASGDSTVSSVITVGQNAPTTCYCTPTVSTIDAQSFTTTGGITNVSVGQTTASGYINYAIDTVSGIAGSTIISFSGSNPGSDGVAIWVDWNQDGTFGSNERVYNTTSYNSSPSGSFTVPAIDGITVLGGITRMRVLNDFNSSNPNTPCSLASGTYGQVQDFSFKVIPLTVCSGTPVAGTASANTAAACPAGSFILSATGETVGSGITYVWQASPTGAGTWATVDSGATPSFASYTVASQTAATDYRMYVLCSGSGLSDTSNAVTVTENPFFNCYCTPSFPDDQFEGVSFLSSFQTTGAVQNVNQSNSYSGGNGYYNYAADTIIAITTTTFNFSGTTGSISPNVGIWIDWNQNGAFESNEQVYNSNGNVSSFSGNITVPALALPGITKVRVVADWFDVPTACDNGEYGTAEDYTINVIAQTACAGMPAPGNTHSSVQSLCVSGTANLSMDNNYLTSAGIAYQWQSSPDGISWSNISGDTSYVATIPVITATTNYRCRVICTAAADTGYSVATQVGVHPLPVVAVTPSQTAFCTSGTATIVASGAATYTWSPSTNLDVTTGNTVNATPTAITTYTVTGVDANNCTNTATATVGPINAFTPIGTATGSCAPNVPVTITATPIATAVGSMQYKLTDTLGTIIADWQAGTAFTITPTVSGAYKYYLFARNTTCASSISDTGTVLFFDGFGATVTANNATCANGNGSLVISNVNGPGAGNSAASWYNNDFSTTTLNATYAVLEGGASITSNYLQLTPNTTSSSGGILVKNPTAINRIDSVTFNLSVPQSGGADGLSWSYGDISYPSVSGYSFEAGVGNKLIISFDAYGTGAPGIQGVYLTYGQQNVDPTAGTNQLYNTVSATMLAYSNYAGWTGATNTPVTIYISSDNKVTLKMGSNVVFSGVQLPAAYANADRSAWQQIIAARTGGISEQHYIDNLGIYYNGVGYSYGASPASSGTMPATWQSSPVFAGLSGGDSLDLWVANPNNQTTCNKFLGTYGVTAPIVTSVLDTASPSCVSTADGYVLLKVGDLQTYNVSYNKNGGSTITQTGLTPGIIDSVTNYILLFLDEGTYTNFKLINPLTSCVSNTLTTPITLTAPAATTIAMASSSADSVSQPGAGTQYYTDGSCDLLAAVTSPNNLGTVTTNLTVGSTIPTSTSGEPFLGRYVDITPSQNSTLPATLKLYFSPADFTAYNASPLVGNANYPAILSDGSNLRIRAFHGSAASGTTGPNGAYNASNADILQPSSIVFNTNGYWEVTVPSPNGFSGFFANTTTGAPLYITIGSISAKNEGKINVVNWSTQTELPGDRFTLERSNDGRVFNTIAEMDAKGKAPSNYTYTDEQPFNGVNYYRLILLNVDGSKDVSKVVTAVVNNGAAFQLAAYPNPATSELTVNVSVVTGKGTVEIVDVTGRTLISKDINGANTMTISLTGLTDGMYIVKYHDDVHDGTIKLNKN